VGLADDFGVKPSSARFSYLYILADFCGRWYLSRIAFGSGTWSPGLEDFFTENAVIDDVVFFFWDMDASVVFFNLPETKQHRALAFVFLDRSNLVWSSWCNRCRNDAFILNDLATLFWRPNH
jgi:hypothetical protein